MYSAVLGWYDRPKDDVSVKALRRVLLRGKQIRVSTRRTDRRCVLDAFLDHLDDKNDAKGYV